MTKKIFITLFIFMVFINISVFADDVYIPKRITENSTSSEFVRQNSSGTSGTNISTGSNSSGIRITDPVSSDSLNGGENMSNVLGTATFKNPFAGMFKFYSEIIIGIVGGVLMTFRLGIELFHAIIMNDASGSVGEVRKVFMRFLIHFIVAVTGASVVFWAFNIQI